MQLVSIDVWMGSLLHAQEVLSWFFAFNMADRVSGLTCWLPQQPAQDWCPAQLLPRKLSFGCCSIQLRLQSLSGDEDACVDIHLQAFSVHTHRPRGSCVRDQSERSQSGNSWSIMGPMGMADSGDLCFIQAGRLMSLAEACML